MDNDTALGNDDFLCYWEDKGTGIAMDSLGNAYVTGDFVRTATFGSTTLTSTGIGTYSLFVWKLGAASP